MKNKTKIFVIIMLFLSLGMKSSAQYYGRFSKKSRARSALLNKYRHGRPQAAFWFGSGFQSDPVQSVLMETDFNLSVSSSKIIVGAGLGRRIFWPLQRSEETPVHGRFTFCFLYGMQIAKVPHNKNEVEKLKYLTFGIQTFDDFRGREVIVQLRRPLKGGLQIKIGIGENKTYLIGIHLNLFFD